MRFFYGRFPAGRAFRYNLFVFAHVVPTEAESKQKRIFPAIPNAAASRKIAYI
jgi:hypothetical protein